MKCPKCSYLGFETGDRCKNCGYDFSLLGGAAAAEVPDLLLRRDSDPIPAGSPDWDRFDRGLGPAAAAAPAAAPPDLLAALPADTVAIAPPAAKPHATAATGQTRVGARAAAPPLPLFQRTRDDDEPLIRLPAAPRPPLAVRRTPDKPRLRTVPNPAVRHEAAVAVAERAEPVLEFPSETTPEEPTRRGRSAPVTEPGPTSGPGKRLGAAVLDHAILTGIDVAVIYFTLKMAGLPLGAWSALPPAPLVGFLAFIKLAYFAAFTLVGGQTIGKMAMGIRVVSSDDRRLDPPRAVQRTLAGVLSVVTLGLAFLPAVLGDRRAVHDRLARTRVVELR